MSQIKSKNTHPEILVRKALFSLGFRFRLHSPLFKGKPDIILPKYKIAIFVNGCFWHRHENCKEASRPKTNSEFWENKISANISRDKKNYSLVEAAGWTPIIIWECALKNDIEYNKIIIKEILKEYGL